MNVLRYVAIVGEVAHIPAVAVHYLLRVLTIVVDLVVEVIAVTIETGRQA